ncbi:hypothetical protein [Actinoplanes sp. G11-F43]|uniref:hypothetical protein n=1 Tax=Actinoplanes sp. G11-F43 TaxID=3424130 RepID=UPI003D352D0D
MATLEERVTRLEKRMDEEARLRAMVDRDLADFGEKLRVQTGLLRALATTQSEHTATLNQHTETLNQHTEILDQHTALFEKVLATLDRHTAMHKEHGVVLATLTLEKHSSTERDEQIIGLLHTLIDREGAR